MMSTGVTSMEVVINNHTPSRCADAAETNDRASPNAANARVKKKMAIY